MDSINVFYAKVNKYMPIFPKATGQPTKYIEGYPYEDDEPKRKIAEAKVEEQAAELEKLRQQLGK